MHRASEDLRDSVMSEPYTGHGDRCSPGNYDGRDHDSRPRSMRYLPVKGQIRASQQCIRGIICYHCRVRTGHSSYQEFSNQIIRPGNSPLTHRTSSDDQGRGAWDGVDE